MEDKLWYVPDKGPLRMSSDKNASTSYLRIEQNASISHTHYSGTSKIVSDKEQLPVLNDENTIIGEYILIKTDILEEKVVISNLDSELWIILIPHIIHSYDLYGKYEKDICGWEMCTVHSKKW